MKNDNENLTIRAVSMLFSLGGLVMVILPLFIGEYFEYWWLMIIGILVSGASGLFAYKKDKIAFWFGVGSAVLSLLFFICFIFYIEFGDGENWSQNAWHGTFDR